MNLFRFTFLNCLLAILAHSYSYSQSESWSQMIGGVGFERLYCMTADNDGNIWIAGLFEDTVDFDTDSGAYLLASKNFQDGFLASYDQDGNFRLAHSMNTTEIRDMECDDQGNLYLVGTLTGLYDSDPGPGTDTIPHNGGVRDMCVMSFDQQGNYRWGRGVGGSASDEGSNIYVDENGIIHAVGYFFNTISIPIDSSTKTLTSQGGTDIMYTRLTLNGEFKEAEAFGGKGFDVNPDLHGSGNSADGFWIVFAADDSITLQLPTGESTLKRYGLSDIIVLNMDTSATVQNAFSIGGSQDDQPKNVVVGPDGNLYFTGTYSGQIDVDPDSGSHLLNSEGGIDAFLVAFANLGTGNNEVKFQNAVNMGGPNNDEPTDLIRWESFGGGGYQLENGLRYEGIINISSGNNDPPTQLTGTGFTDLAIVRYPDPISLFAEEILQINGNEAETDLRIAVGPGSINKREDPDCQRIFIAGQASGNLHWNQACDTLDTLNTNGFFDIFLGTLNIPPDSTTSIFKPIEPTPLFVYPNPVEEILYIDFPKPVHEQFSMSIYNLQGQLMKEEKLDQKSEISVGSLPTGVYFLQVISASGERYTSRFMKN